MEFSGQEYWSGLPFPSPGNVPHPRIEPRPTTLQADSLPSEPPEKHQKVLQKALCQLSIPNTQTHPLLGSCLDSGASDVDSRAIRREAATTPCGQNPEVTSALKVHPYTLLCAFKHHKAVLLRQVGTLNTKFHSY